MHDAMKRRIFAKLSAMEGRKLDVEIARWKGHRPHLRLRERLMENRFAALRAKGGGA